MQSPDEIANALRAGEITSEDALARFDAHEAPWKYLKSISLETSKVEISESGFTMLDEHMLLKKNTHELISIAALPGMGKSQLVFQIAAKVAETKEVLLFSTEMTANIIAARIAAARHTVALKKIFSGEALFDKKYPAMREDLNSLRLGIVDDFTKSISEVVRIASSAAKKHPLGLIVLDQMPQLQEFYDGLDGIARITSSLKTLAKQCQCPVINVCQLNRSLQNRSKQRDKNGVVHDDGKPVFSDLKGSSCIEQDSDVILVLTGNHEARPNITELGIIKNKNGKRGWTELGWYDSFVQFRNLEIQSL